jgi:hypothetical protein
MGPKGGGSTQQELSTTTQADGRPTARGSSTSGVIRPGTISGIWSSKTFERANDAHHRSRAAVGRRGRVVVPRSDLQPRRPERDLPVAPSRVVRHQVGPVVGARDRGRAHAPVRNAAQPTTSGGSTYAFVRPMPTFFEGSSLVIAAPVGFRTLVEAVSGIFEGRPGREQRGDQERRRLHPVGLGSACWSPHAVEGYRPGTAARRRLER